TSFNLAFFSESRVRLISERLGHTKLRELIETITRAEQTQQADQPTSYFDHVHRLYPLLDRIEFEKIALAPTLPGYLTVNLAFSALYHTVLALGCQYTGEGSFNPGKGRTWKFDQVVLGLLPEILVPTERITNLQVFIPTKSHYRYCEFESFNQRLSSSLTIDQSALYTLNLSCVQMRRH
ncbi:uncharacterized protein N7479_001104, partial [Penicillium vulpinum]|uniref:uncharacterized protein n=1 Tax=Penicillium vulpinum TaxID=29845 RepID=UPI00254701B9